jgi:hypothetical protein
VRACRYYFTLVGVLMQTDRLGGAGDAKPKAGALDRSSGGTPGAHDFAVRTEADFATVQYGVAIASWASCVARCAIFDGWPVSETQPALIR